MLVEYIFSTVIVSSVAYGRNLRRERNLHCNENSRIDIISEAGVRIEPYENSKAYIETLAKPFEDGDTLKFEFKTTSSNATLFYAVRHTDKYDMVSGGVQDGFMHFKIRCKSSFADLTIPKFRVDDGEWHKIKFHRRKRKGIFLLDDIEFFEQYYVGCQGFTSVNFGSTHPDHDSSYSVQELKPKNGQLSGCIRLVQISTGIVSSPHYHLVSECN